MRLGSANARTSRSAASRTGISRPRGRNRSGAWGRLAACAGAAALVQMDGTIVVVALPSVGDTLGAGPDAVSWVITAYFLAFAAALVPGGRIVDRLGSRNAAAIGLALFAVGAAVGALSHSLWPLLAGRAIQGVGAGLVSPASLAGAVSGFAPERRGRALGVWGASSGVANLAGPVIGGVVTASLGWRFNWWVMLPLAAAAAFWMLRLAPGPTRAAEAAASSAVKPPMRVVMAAAGVALITFLVMIETFFLAQEYLQTTGGLSPLDAAAPLMLVAGLVVVAAPIAGRISDSFGERIPAVAGFCLVAVGLGSLSIPGVPLDSPAALALAAPVGLGLGILFVPASRAALNSVPQTMHGRVSAIMSGARLVGAAAGSAAAGFALAGGAETANIRKALLVAAAICVALGIPASLGLRRSKSRLSGLAADAPSTTPAARRSDDGDQRGLLPAVQGSSAAGSAAPAASEQA